MVQTRDSGTGTETTASIARSEDASVALAVIGVGNQIMGDDGVGPRVIETLRSSPLGENPMVALANAGTTAFFALEAMNGCDRAIVIDAIETGSDPGTIHQYRYVDGAFAGEIPEMTMHDFSFAEALEAGREAYDIPERVLILGVEPARIEPSMDLSESIERTVPSLVDRVREEIAEQRS